MGNQSEAAEEISQIADETPANASNDDQTTSPSVTDDAGNTVQLDDSGTDKVTKEV